MADKTLFALRRAPESSELNALEGGFRIQIPPKELRILGLKSGDFCRLVSEDGKKGGLAIAWQSSDVKDAGKRIIKITDCLKETYRLSLEDKVSVAKTEERLQPAESVTVSNASDSATLDAFEEEEVKFWVSHSLVKLEAVVPIGTFKVELRQASGETHRLRFLVENVVANTTSEIGSPRGSRPTYFSFQTKVIINSDLPRKTGPQATNITPQISLDGVGGLQKQIDKLNEKLRILNDDLRRLLSPPAERKRGTGILLHGPSGTGKSLLLDKFAEAGWSSNYRLDSAVLPMSVAQSQTVVRDTFAKALKSQPSVILMDRLEDICGKPETGGSASPNIANSLIAEMDKTRGTKVLVVATTSSLANIDSRLRKRTLFSEEIEIPVPDATSRTEILKVLQQKDRHVADALSETIGLRTHGFVGSDLEDLYTTAWDYAYRRHRETNTTTETNAAPEEPKSNTNAESPTAITISAPETANANSSATEPTSEPPSLTVTLQDFEQAMHSVRPTAMKEIFLETPTVRWSDIGGSDAVRQALAKVTSRPFNRPDLVKTLDLRVHRGILLYGPPGCSKTLCAKAVATESGFNFLAVKGAELISMYVGESERAVREVFRKARAASPSIIFFDEIDAIAAGRAAGEGGHASSGLNVLTTLLNEMDGIEALNDVLVLAATNRPDVLDAALLRPGRFDAKIYVGLPNSEARTQIVEIANRRRPVGVDVGAEQLARRLEGYTGAEVVQICNEAASAVADEWEERPASTDGEARMEICWRHYEEAMKKVGKGVSAEMVDRFLGWTGEGMGF